MMAHIPVLLDEVMDILQLKENDTIIDATFGAGGHTREILKRFSGCHVIAFDRDLSVQKYADQLKSEYEKQFFFINDRFSNMYKYITDQVDAILFDLGVSSMQLDCGERGFSFMKEAKLDMRMSQNDTESAYTYINSKIDTKFLSELFVKYGGETRKNADRIAKAIADVKKIKKIETTTELRDIIHGAKHNSKYEKIDAATKVFQAIRIFINDEYQEICNALEQFPKILTHGARVAIITFHSGEDAFIKSWYRKNCANFMKINKKIIRPTEKEIYSNNRARSARLRGFVYV